MMSGKRKSGKDFVASRLYKHFGEDVSIIRLSAPLKKAFATENNLDYENLLTSGMYKELYRKVTFCLKVLRVGCSPQKILETIKCRRKCFKIL